MDGNGRKRKGRRGKEEEGEGNEQNEKIMNGMERKKEGRYTHTRVNIYNRSVIRKGREGKGRNRSIDRRIDGWIDRWMDERMGG